MHATGLPVGLLPGRGYQEETVTLGETDLLFFYTDGTVEIENEQGEFFGYERLASVITRERTAGVEAVLADVEDELRAFRGAAEPSDDATMMALRLERRPRPDPRQATGYAVGRRPLVARRTGGGHQKWLVARRSRGVDPGDDGDGSGTRSHRSEKRPAGPRPRHRGRRLSTPGALNAITDVAGVAVGHTTVIEGDHVRTGVTAILPHDGNLFQEKVAGAVFVGNAFGKLAGSTQVEELGTIETPIVLTNTLSVGDAVEAVVAYTLGSAGQ